MASDRTGRQNYTNRFTEKAGRVAVSITTETVPFWHKEDNKPYLLVAGGRPPAGDWLRRAAKDCVVYCADRGVSYCRAAGIRPDCLVGDGDSGGADWLWAREAGTLTVGYPRDKDQTDLQLTLAAIEKAGNCKSVLATGLWGGRFDHVFSAVFTLADWARSCHCPVLISDGREVYLPLWAGSRLEIEFGRKKPEIVSVLPMTQEASVSLSGARWPLKEEIVSQNRPYTVSNRLRRGTRKLDFAVHLGLAGLYLGSENKTVMI